MEQLKNKFILAPLKLGYAKGDGIVTEKHLNFYRQRNRYIGAITPEPLYMDAGLRELPTQLGIDADDKLEGLTQLTQVIKEHGAAAIAHLNHPGRMANPKIPYNYFVSSTSKACENGGATPERMNREMMDRVIEMFAVSAKRAVKAGFDIIELQFGHGYLLAQFLSPAVNDRKDEYNGSLEKRAKFPLEVLDAVKDAVDVPLIARISGDEMIPGGLSLGEMKQFSSMLQEHGIDAIHVSAGSSCSTPPWFFQHMFVPKGKTWQLASEISEVIDIPVIYVGQINTREDVQTLESQYQADYIALGRALVADADFVGKLLDEVEGNIRPCLACSEGCLGNVKKGKGLGCVVNPLVNNNLPELKKAENPRKIAVIGGGLAGMQSAIVLKERGHDVVIFEQERLGGQFILASLPPRKQSLHRIVDFFVAELKRLQIPVIYKEATKKELDGKGFDDVIMATGARPVIPPIKGLKKYYWTEFLNNDQLPENETVLIVGGGLIAMEMASKLVDAKNQVIIIEMLDEIGRGMEMLEKAQTLKKLHDNGVQIYTRHKAASIEGNMVFIENDNNLRTKIEGVDKVIVAAGMKSYVPFEPNTGVRVHYVGDAKQVGKAENAIHDAYKLALEI